MIEIYGFTKILILLIALVIKHFIADFLLQTPFMYMNKGTYGHLGGVYHAFIHACFTVLILLILGSSNWLYLSLADFVIHYHMDWFKTWHCNKQRYTPNDFPYWFWLGFDQLVHYLTYILIIWKAF